MLQSMKKGMFLNLPNKNKVMRRYMCSYNSPTFFFQPIELLSLAGVFRTWHKGNAFLVDSIAEELDTTDVIEIIKKHQPDFIISLSGFECFEEDMAQINSLKVAFPGIPFVLFGHYASVFYEKIMEETSVDVIIHGEPDLGFSDWVNNARNEEGLKTISGISYKICDKIIHQAGSNRIPDPNKLPLPAFDLLKNHLYGEPFFPKPFGLIQSARGCPYQCNYCVKSYGTRLTSLSPENIIKQIEAYVKEFKINSFRFIDDTFTAIPDRVISFCKLMIEKKYQTLSWSCLSRSDTLNREMLYWMKAAGCKRIYIGMESGSQKILDLYNKKTNVIQSLQDIQYAKELGFELMGFFMVGIPGEEESDLQLSINFAKEANFDFIIISQLSVYPGTPLFGALKDKINFSLLPYKNTFIDHSLASRANQFEKKFYRQFYFRQKFIINALKKYAISFMNEMYKNFYSLSSYILSNRTDEKRKDFI